MKTKVALLVNDKKVFEAVPKRTLATLVLTAARNDTGLLFEARARL